MVVTRNTSRARRRQYDQFGRLQLHGAFGVGTGRLFLGGVSMSLFRPRTAVVVLLNALALAFPVAAQVQNQGSPVFTRAQLLERARIADSLGQSDEALLLRNRLRDGDFLPGDRIAVAYEGAALTGRDTLIVSTGRIVRLGQPMGDLNLTGVLSFEVADSITSRFATYFKNEVVHVVPLVRVQVSGAVKAPGYYYVSPDVLFGDLIMRNAGQDQNSDMHHIVVKRGGQVIWSSKDVQAALSGGLTVSNLGLSPGDEVVVGARRAPPWALLATLGGTILTAVVVQMIAARHR